MPAPGHHIHGKLLKQEVWVVAGAVTLFFGYFALSMFAEGDKVGLFNNIFGSSNFFPQLLSVLVTVWKQDITPVFVVLDILLIFVGLYALVQVWPLKQSMKLFTLQPHGHGGDGHEHHGHAHATHAAAQGVAHHQGNPATIKHWASIVHRANTGTAENLRWAVMEADALVDFVLKQRGITGEGMAERLQNAGFAGLAGSGGQKLISRVFDAHRLRNELAHTPGFAMTTQQAERALFAFRDFLKELREF